MLSSSSRVVSFLWDRYDDWIAAEGQLTTNTSLRLKTLHCLAAKTDTLHTIERTINETAKAVLVFGDQVSLTGEQLAQWTASEDLPPSLIGAWCELKSHQLDCEIDLDSACTTYAKTKQVIDDVMLDIDELQAKQSYLHDRVDMFKEMYLKAKRGAYKQPSPPLEGCRLRLKIC